MTPRLARFAVRLPFSASDRHAVEALLNDWRFEVERSHGFPAAALVSVRWGVALCSTLCRIGIREAAVSAAWQPVLIGVAMTAVVAAVLQFVLRSPSRSWDMAIDLWLVPSFLTAWMAPTLALTMPWTRRAAPLGSTLIVATVMVVLVGWVAPATNQAFREGVYMQLANPPLPGEPRPGAVELSVGELLARAGKGVHLETVRSQLSVRSALVLWALSGLVLGIQVRRRRKAEPGWRGTLLAVGAITLAIGGVAAITALVMSTGARTPVNPTWTYVVWFAAVSFWIGRSRRDAAPHPQAGAPA